MSIHDALERSKLPLLIVVAVPVVALLYVLFGADLSTPASSTPTQTATQAPAAPASLPQAALSLDDPQSLPTSVSKAGLVPFSLTVQNPSQQNATYQYKVSVRWSTGENDVIDENTISLPAGASKTISEQLKFEIATETAEVLFELPQTGQSVRFALPRNG